MRVVDIAEFTRQKVAPRRVNESRGRIALAWRRLSAPAAISIQIADRRRGLCRHAAAAAAQTPHTLESLFAVFRPFDGGTFASNYHIDKNGDRVRTLK